MTKQEYSKLEKLMEEGVQKAEASVIDFNTYEEFMKKNDTVGAEVAQRKGDQNLGYAEGVYQVLVTIGFKHERMEELLKLIS